MDSSKKQVCITYVGGPTSIIELGGLRILTDPTFDPPGEYPVGQRILTKLVGPALLPDQIDDISLVLLSHDQHPDNLDKAGKEFALGAPLFLSTQAARERLGEKVTVLPVWEKIEITRPDGKTLTVMGVPAQHGPDNTEHLVGEVRGFVLSAEDLPTVYVSGDNASLRIVKEIAERVGKIDIALLFAGGAQTPLVEGAFLTLASKDAAQAAQILRARHVVPLHFEHWGHFTQGRDTLETAFAEAGISDNLHLLQPGNSIEF